MMKSSRILLFAPVLALCTPHPLLAQSVLQSPAQATALYAFATQPVLAVLPAYSSSLSWENALPVAPAAALGGAYKAHTRVEAVYRPFVSTAVAVRLGAGGVGGELATYLSHRLNLRVGGDAFTYSTTFTTNGLNAAGTLKLGDSFAALDLHPFRNGFRLSPGLTFYNRNNVSANLNVPGGNNFTLNSVDYTSEASDPVNGTAVATFGNKVSPRLTLGWGNSFPRYGGHWSFPIELGFYYTSAPTVAISLSGSACSSSGCGSINTPDNEVNIQGEEARLNSDLAPARFFPVFSLGVGYRFGH
jgi:hypothetical protein